MSSAGLAPTEEATGKSYPNRFHEKPIPFPPHPLLPDRLRPKRERSAAFAGFVGSEAEGIPQNRCGAC